MTRFPSVTSLGGKRYWLLTLLRMCSFPFADRVISYKTKRWKRTNLFFMFFPHCFYLFFGFFPCFCCFMFFFFQRFQLRHERRNLKEKYHLFSLFNLKTLFALSKLSPTTWAKLKLNHMVFVKSSYFQVFRPHGHTKPAFSNSPRFEKRLRTAPFAVDNSPDYKICTLLKMGAKERNLCFETSGFKESFRTATFSVDNFSGSV